MGVANYVMDDGNIFVITWDKLKEVAEEDTVMVKLKESVEREGLNEKIIGLFSKVISTN